MLLKEWWLLHTAAYENAETEADMQFILDLDWFRWGRDEEKEVMFWFVTQHVMYKLSGTELNKEVNKVMLNFSFAKACKKN